MLALDPPSLASASFHAQQSAEKALKALLTRFERQVDKTHDLGALLASAEHALPGIAALLPDLEHLTPFAVSGRYPGGPRLIHEIAERHVEVARHAIALIREALGAYLDSEPSAT